MPPARFELTAPGLGILCSILLSYGGTWKPVLASLVFTIGYFFVIIFQEERSNFGARRNMNDFKSFFHPDSFWLAIVSAAMISGCTASATPLNITLHNSKTGTERTCSAKQSSSKNVSILAAAVESCAKQLESRGFVRSDSH